MIRLIPICAGLLLGGCALFQSLSNQITTGNSNGIPTPGVGQWAAYGRSENQVQGGNTIVFDCCSGGKVSGYYYTRLPSAPRVGQTLTLTYTLTGNNPVFAQAPGNPTDTNPASNSLLIWQSGDNLSCQGDFNFYRLFPRAQFKLRLELGTHTLSVPLTGANWQGCYPAQVVTDGRLQQALNNLTGIGFTFGGARFDGHGIYLASGSAQFQFKLTVQ